MEAEDSAKLIREYIVAIKTILPVRSRMLDRKIYAVVGVPSRRVTR
jgi:hypothetical protein